MGDLIGMKIKMVIEIKIFTIEQILECPLF